MEAAAPLHAAPVAMLAAHVSVFPRCCNAPSPDEPGSDGGPGRGGILDGLKILVVEDDFIVAFDMQMMLEEQGAQVLGPAATVAQARAIIGNDAPQLAVLDVNLNGEFVFPLAQELAALGVPFLFATAYADDVGLFPETAREIPRLAKPVLPNVLVGRLRKLLDGDG